MRALVDRSTAADLRELAVAVSRDLPDGVLGHAINLGHSEPIEVRRLIELLAEAVSDAQGEVRLWNLTPGAYTVRWLAPDFIDLAKEEAIVLLVAGTNALPANRVQHRTTQLGHALMQISPQLSTLIAPTAE